MGSQNAIVDQQTLQYMSLFINFRNQNTYKLWRNSNTIFLDHKQTLAYTWALFTGLEKKTSFSHKYRLIIIDTEIELLLPLQNPTGQSNNQEKDTMS